MRNVSDAFIGHIEILKHKYGINTNSKAVDFAVCNFAEKVDLVNNQAFKIRDLETELSRLKKERILLKVALNNFLE